MTKKRFSGGLDTLLGEEKTNHPTIEEDKSAIEPEEIRTSIILEKTLIEKIRAIAYWERILIKDFIGSTLKTAIEKYEKEVGEIKPIPRK